MNFLNLLEGVFKEDVSTTRSIIKSKWDKTVDVIKEAFDGSYVDKELAIHKITTDFIDEKITPKNLDIDFIKENQNYIIDKIQSLTEGDIKIIINNNDSDKKSGGCPMAVEVESIDATKKKRGRPPKQPIEEKKEDVEELEVIEDVPEVEDEKEPKKEKEDKKEEKEEEKQVTIKIKGNEVKVDFSKDIDLKNKKHECEDEEGAVEYAESIKKFFEDQGFDVELESDVVKESVDILEAADEDGMKLVATKDGYDFYIKQGKDGKNTLYNIVPEKSEAPEGGYRNKDYIEHIKHVKFPEDVKIESKDSKWKDLLDKDEEDETVDEAKKDIKSLLKIGKLCRLSSDDKWYVINDIDGDVVYVSDEDGKETETKISNIAEVEEDIKEEDESENVEEAKKMPAFLVKEAKTKDIRYRYETYMPRDKGVDEDEDTEPIFVEFSVDPEDKETGTPVSIHIDKVVKQSDPSAEIDLTDEQHDKLVDMITSMSTEESDEYVKKIK